MHTVAVVISEKNDHAYATNPSFDTFYKVLIHSKRQNYKMFGYLTYFHVENTRKTPEVDFLMLHLVTTVTSESDMK
jgi:hypothetical protein